MSLSARAFAVGSVGDVSLYRVASLATVATEVAQRMGWIRKAR
jgi:hypothetical protein